MSRLAFNMPEVCQIFSWYKAFLGGGFISHPVTLLRLRVSLLPSAHTWLALPKQSAWLKNQLRQDIGPSVVVIFPLNSKLGPSWRVAIEKTSPNKLDMVLLLNKWACGSCFCPSLVYVVVGPGILCVLLCFTSVSASFSFGRSLNV